MSSAPSRQRANSKSKPPSYSAKSRNAGSRRQQADRRERANGSSKRHGKQRFEDQRSDQRGESRGYAGKRAPSERSGGGKPQYRGKDAPQRFEDRRSNNRGSDDRRSDDRRSNNRGSDDRRSYDRGSEDRRSNNRRPQKRRADQHPYGRSKPRSGDGARRSANRPPKVATLNGPSGFTPLGVPDPLAAVLQQQGIEQPYPIQEATIPDAISGRDVLGRGRTGSGKTLSFCLPLVIRLSQPGPRARRRSPRGLILVPTRELAAQVMDVLKPLVAQADLDVTLVIGGASYDKQISRLSNGTDIIVATPGRLFDLTERGAADLSHIATVVLDEADQMADMGFLPQVEVLMAQVPKHGQRLLYSATLDHDVDALVERYLHDPSEHATDPGTATVTTMDHKVLVVPNQGKQRAATAIARDAERSIVFLRTRAAVERAVEEFTAAGMPADMLHGGMSQRARSRALDRFRHGSTQVLVATDVAARGIDVTGISVVLQWDIPADHKDYLHRAGRTARAGAHGTVVTLVEPRQQRRMQRLLREAGVEGASVEYPQGRPARKPRRAA